MAIGAQRSDVIALVMRRALMSCLVGLLVGLGSALALRKIIASQLYGASAADPAVFLAVSTLIILVGLFAAFLPARAAARTDPLMSLKRD
jgi:ABC-type antimicrobial peptide transport system permease subunit